MTKRSFALEPGGPKRLEVSWGLSYRSFAVSLDGQRVEPVGTKALLKQGMAWTLPDGSRLEAKIRTATIHGHDLLLYRDGLPVPGSGADPSSRLKLAVGILCYVAAVNTGLGVLALAMHLQPLLQAGLGAASIGEGVIYAGLAYGAHRRSRAALVVAILLYLADTVLTVSTSHVGGGFIVRIVLLVALIRGLQAAQELRRPGSPVYEAG